MRRASTSTFISPRRTVLLPTVTLTPATMASIWTTAGCAKSLAVTSRAALCPTNVAFLPASRLLATTCIPRTSGLPSTPPNRPTRVPSTPPLQATRKSMLIPLRLGVSNGIGTRFVFPSNWHGCSCCGGRCVVCTTTPTVCVFRSFFHCFSCKGVDYLKVDGCGDRSYYPTGYPKMGKALVNSGRDIVYSCSWPAYLGNDEASKPYDVMIASHCNLWRNWRDIQCNWGSLSSIIDHWGDYGPVLAKYAAAGHFNDPDMLLIGNDCITDVEAATQMAIWSIIAAPLIMGNDLRNITASQKEILLNKDAIAVNQDSLVQQGLRITPKGDTEVWARNLSDGSVAVGLYNKNGHPSPAPPPPPTSCSSWNITQNGYLEACDGKQGNIGCFEGQTLKDVQQECCDNPYCAGFSFEASKGYGCLKKNTDCGMHQNNSFVGYDKPSFTPPQPGPPVNITVNFADVGLSGSVKVYDIWTHKQVGVFSSSFSAEVPFHGTGFYRLTKA
eukprot:m.133143 g.133143  ORF g.133143 m.133143 type:complete len:499 (-) comp16874_c0_seq4:137-1633(-)